MKKYVVISTESGFDDYIYYYYKRLPRLVVRLDDKYVILVRFHGKQAAINGYMEAVNQLVRQKTNVCELVMIVDRDEDYNTKLKIVEGIKSLNSRFTSDPISFVEDDVLENMKKLSIDRNSIQLRSWIIDVTPNLDEIIASFIKEQNVLPKDKCQCDYDTIIDNAKEYFNVDINGLCSILFESHGNKLSTYLQRRGIKNPLCQIFK